MRRKIIIICTIITLLLIFVARTFAEEKGKYSNIIKKLENENIKVENLEIKKEQFAPIPYILDMDFCTDVDDVCALRLANKYDFQNVIDLKAVGLCTNGDNITNAVEGLLDYDNLTNVPVGISSTEEFSTSPYWDTLANFKQNNHSKRDAVTLYKEILKENKNVIITTTGYTTNIALLLKDKEGYELVKNNCKAIYIQGGSYPTGWDNNFAYTDEAIEAIKYVSNHCPVNLYFISNDIGDTYSVGNILQENNPDDPVAKALATCTFDNSRAGWNSTAVWISIQQNNENLKIIPVQFEIDEDGINTFIEDEHSNIYIILKNSNDIEYFQMEIDKLI